MATGKQHPNPPGLLKFCARPDQSADYVRRTAEWVKKEYPGSVDVILPKLRKIYREKMQGHQAAVS